MPESEQQIEREQGSRNSRAMLVAAVVLVIIGGGAYWQTHRDRQRDAENRAAVSHAEAYPAGRMQPQKMEIQVTPLPAAPPEDKTVPRGGSQADKAQRDALSVALEPYRKGDYLASIAALQNMLHQFPTSGEAALYLGVSQVLIWQNVQATQTLATAANELSGQRRQAAEWYRAVALLRTGDPGAQQAFSNLCSEGGEPYSQPACEISPKVTARQPQASYSVPR